jgi:hypothetical protein
MKRVVQLLVVAACLLDVTPAQARSDQPLLRPPHVAGDEVTWHVNGPIVFVRTLDGDADLWSVGADGSDLRRLTSSRRSDTEPAWSPKGSKIVFVRSTPTGGQDLYTLDLRGGRPTLFLTDGEAPAWSPDGSRLAFSRTVQGNTDVYSVSTDGTDQQQLTTDDGVDTDPWWGPDGTRVTFASDRDGDFDIFTMDPDGSNQRALTDTILDERNPWEVWSWRNLGYDQGDEGNQLMCWQQIGPPVVLPGDPDSCDDVGHSYSVGTWSPYAWLVGEPNGRSHLWAQVCCDPSKQLTSGRRTDSDPAMRPATPAVVAALTRAAGDLDMALRGAQAWVETNGSGTGADAGPSGLTTQAPGLCLVEDMEPSSATTSTCDAGVGTGSTSVYAGEDEIGLARDTGLGVCLFAHYQAFGNEWEALFGATGTPGDCTGQKARFAFTASW